jgi:hypothetical protein
MAKDVIANHARIPSWTCASLRSNAVILHTFNQNGNHRLGAAAYARCSHPSTFRFTNQQCSFLYNLAAMPKMPPSKHSSKLSGELVEIQRAGEVLTFTLNNPDRGNEVTGTMFDAMLAELRSQSKPSKPGARVLRIRAGGSLFCTGRERAGCDKKSVLFWWCSCFERMVSKDWSSS